MLAVITSAGVLVCYSVFYAPKEKRMFAEYETFGHLRDDAGSPAAESAKDPQFARIEKALGIHFTMSYVVAKGLLAVAISVVILSCATLATSATAGAL